MRSCGRGTAQMQLASHLRAYSGSCISGLIMYVLCTRTHVLGGSAHLAVLLIIEHADTGIALDVLALVV